MASERRRERKVVTVLFCDLVGFTQKAETLDPEDVEAMLRPYHARVREELERHGGTVEKFIGDAVMALFGAPVAHEDDPERAVRAGLAIRDFAVEKGIELRVGVTTGEALVSLDTHPSEGEGMASGDVVNTAARLQSAAPVNGVLVDETTYRATRTAITYEDAEPVEAKGKAGPIPVWQATGARSRFGVDVTHHARAELVGRERELSVLRDAFERARHERIPQLVTLVAVPGMARAGWCTSCRGSWTPTRSLSHGARVAAWPTATVWPSGPWPRSSRRRRAFPSATRRRRPPPSSVRQSAMSSATQATPAGSNPTSARCSASRPRPASAATAAARPLLPGGASSRRLPSSARSCSYWRTCTGPTMDCSTSSMSSSTG